MKYHGSISISRQVLIAAVHPIPNRLDRIDDHSWKEVDWTWLLSTAQKHKIAALMVSRLLQPHLRRFVTDPVRERFIRIRKESEERSQLTISTLHTVAEHLDRREIPFVLLKGEVLAQLLYRCPSLRPSYDLDLGVGVDSLEDAEEVLKSLGFRNYLWGKNREEMLRTGYDLSFMPPDKGLSLRPVELLWRLNPGYVQINLEDMWQHTREFHLHGITIRALSFEANLIHLAIHAISDALELKLRLLSLCDIARFITRLRNELSWDKVWGLADSWGARYYLERSLFLVDRVFGIREEGGLVEGATSLLLSYLSWPVTSEREIIDQPLPRNRYLKNLKRILNVMLLELSLARCPSRSLKWAVTFAGKVAH